MFRNIMWGSWVDIRVARCREMATPIPLSRWHRRLSPCNIKNKYRLMEIVTSIYCAWYFWIKMYYKHV